MSFLLKSIDFYTPICVMKYILAGRGYFFLRSHPMQLTIDKFYAIITEQKVILDDLAKIFAIRKDLYP